MIRRRRRHIDDGSPPPPPGGGAARHRDTAALLAASNAVNSTLGLGEALRVVLTSAKQLLGAHEGSVMLLGEDSYLRIVVSEGIPPDIAANTKIGLGESIAGRVAESGSPLLITGRAQDEGFQSLVDRQRPLKSALSVPLRVAGRTTGVLNLNITSGSQRFDEDDLALAEVFAEQAAIAIHKAQLLEESQRRGSDLARLFDASRGLVGLLEMEPLLSRVLDGGSALTGARAGFVCLLDDSGRLRLGVYRGIPRHEIRDIIGRQGFLDLIRGEGARVVRMTEQDAFAGLRYEGDLATLVPIRAEGKTRAMLVLIGDPPDQGSLRLLENYATQAALAIRNAQLYKQVGDKETELAAIVYSMGNPVIVVDSGGTLVAANPAAEELFNFSTDFLRGQPVHKAIDVPELLELLTGNSEGTIEVSVGRPDSKTWKAHTSRISTPDARQGFILVLDDVTAEREMEALKADFVAVIGHELRTPLTSIKGYIRTLLRAGERMTEEQRRDSLATVDAQAQHLERLIENLLFVSRITDTDVLRLEFADLVLVASAMIEESRGRHPSRSFVLEAPSSVGLDFDRTKTEQILFHLLDNACKYSGPDTPVVVGIDEGPEEVRVSVTDKGVGILSGDLAHLFDRFHQVDLSSTRRHGGMGVGLYICKRFAEAQGGRIEVESAWGKGSTFTFTIPKTG